MRERHRRLLAMRQPASERPGVELQRPHDGGGPATGTPETQGRPARPPALGRYAVLGLLALALSLAGVLGGHHLLEQVLGPGDGDDVLASASAPEGSPECSPHLRAADACDFDSDVRSLHPLAPPATTPERE